MFAYTLLCLSVSGVGIGQMPFPPPPPTPPYILNASLKRTKPSFVVDTLVSFRFL